MKRMVRIFGLAIEQPLRWVAGDDGFGNPSWVFLRRYSPAIREIERDLYHVAFVL